MKNDTFNYIRTSQNLAHTLALVSESQEAKQIHKEIIPLMIKHNLKNDLARAYHTQQFIILNNKNISRKEKIFELNALRKNCLETTDNPAVIVEALKIFAQVNNDNNMPADIIIEDIELYFKYQQMFANAVEEETLLSQRDTEMKVMLFSLLAEIGDVQKLDYWNKIFEKQKTRTIENVSVRRRLSSSSSSRRWRSFCFSSRGSKPTAIISSITLRFSRACVSVTAG